MMVMTMTIIAHSSHAESDNEEHHNPGNDDILAQLTTTNRLLVKLEKRLQKRQKIS